MQSDSLKDSPGAPDDNAFAPYRPIREIGRGAHGSVFVAEGPSGLAAIKICRKPDERDRLVNWERERRGWLLFSTIPPHPGLVRVLGTGETADGSAFWIAMELADPETEDEMDAPDAYRPLTLASVADAEIALPLGRCLAIGERIASALEHLQSHHLLHRDVKPGNILFVRGRPVVADAGLVVDVREAVSLVGTPGYEPPEHHGTPQGDVFSLGRTLWRISTGRPPEEAGSAPCAEADLSDPDFGRFLAIVIRAMSSDPSRRYRSAKAMRKALANLRKKRLGRRIAQILLPSLAVLCAALLLGLVWTLGRRSAATPPRQEAGDIIDEAFRTGKLHVLTPEEAHEKVRKATEAVRRARLQAKKAAEQAKDGAANTGSENPEKNPSPPDGSN
jgi:serine/threonine protein kinase